MYERTAAAYDLLMSARGKDYAREAKLIREIVARRAPGARTLLDVACGTGGHLQHLAADLDVVGVDASAAMLDSAATKVPHIELLRADMRTFRLDRRFDVVVCLFSSIGYLYPEHEMRRGIQNMAAHLTEQGVMLVEPWVHPDTWRGDGIDAASAVGEDLAVARVVRSTRAGDVATVEMSWLLASADGVEAVHERHRTGLYSRDSYHAAFTAAGLDVDYDPVGPMGRGLFVGWRAV